MNAEAQLRALLEPLGVYRWNGSFQWKELQSEGKVLDEIAAELAHIQKEMCLLTAEKEGISYLYDLFLRLRKTETLQKERETLAALLRIGSGSFTPAAMNDSLRGCGIPAVVEETQNPYTLSVSFPTDEVTPDNFPALQPIIENILPCHLNIDYHFPYRVWEKLETEFASWTILECEAKTWKALENQI